jgi:D-3-phosphoglycerate dehydrogenase
MKILLTHTPQMREQYYGNRALAGLRAFGEVVLHERADALQPDELIAAAAAADLIVADRLTTVPAPIFGNLPRLKAVLRVAVDIRNIDVDAASAAGVLVTRAKPGFVQSVTELTLGFLIDLSRGVSRYVAAYQAGRMPEMRLGRQLSGSRIGIIGYGAIGRYLAPIVHALGMEVSIADPYATVEDRRFRHVPLEALLAESDYVVCLAVATEETENLINAATLSLMKRDAVFLNLSRGNLVDDEALASALETGRIAGAALDVGRALDQMPTLRIASLPNVIATPHIAGLTPPAIEAQALDTVEQVRALVSGQVPHGAVNTEHWTRRP